MRILGKRIVAFAVLFSQVFCGQVWASEREGNLCYKNVIDTENSNFEEGVWKYRFISSFGEELILEEGRKHTFLIINGSMSSENIVIENGRSYIGIDGICSELNLSKKEEENAITIENGLDSVILDKKSLSMRRDNDKLNTKGIIVNNEIYVPIRELSELFNATVTYSEANIMPLYNPLINIDNREKVISKDQALRSAKEKIQESYRLYKPNDLYADKDTYIDRMEILKEIDDMQCVDETASFWIIKGPRLLIIDKATGIIYYKIGDGKAGHGSYIEAIEQLDENEDDLFENIMIRGF